VSKRKTVSFSEKASKGFAWNHLYKIVEYGLFQLYSVLVVRHFGPELSAPYSVFLSVATTLSIVAAFAVDGVLLRYTPRILAEAEASNDRKTLVDFLNKLFAFRLLTAVFLSVVLFLICFILPSVLPGSRVWIGSFESLWPLLIVFLFGQALTAFSTWTMMGLLQVRSVFFASLVTRGVMLAAGVALVTTDIVTIGNATAVFSFAALLNGSLLLYWLHREIDHHFPPQEPSNRILGKHTFREIFSWFKKPMSIKVFLSAPMMLYGITTWGSDILSTVLGRQPDILMLRGMFGEQSAQIGLYHAASLIVLMTEYILLFGLGGTLVSVFSSLAKRDEEQHAGGKKEYPALLNARKEIASFQIVATFPLFAFMMFFAHSVTLTIYGTKFIDAAHLVIAGVVFLAINVGLFGGGMQITSLVAIGKERIVFKNRLSWGIINLVGNYFLIRQWGALGALIGTQFCNAGACATESYFAGKFIGSTFKLDTLLKIAVLSIVPAYLGYLAAHTLIPDLPLIQCAVGGAISLGGSLGLYILLQIPEAGKVIERVKRLLKISTPAATVPTVTK